MAREIGRVAALWRYPVKSMLGEALPSLDIDRRGAAGDRLFAIRDAGGKFGSGKSSRRFSRIDGLFGFSAALDGGTPLIRFPDGRVLRGGDPGLHAALSAALGQPVTLAREDAAPHFDAAPLHLIASTDLARLSARLPRSGIDARRFRANIVVAGELGALGSTLRIGERLRIRIVEPTERCVMVTNAQDELEQRPEILRELAQHDDACFGVYAEVIEPATVKQGDQVAIG